MERRINVRGVIFKDNQLLAVKHRSHDGGEAGYWALPGGGLDPHESLQAGLERELIEETGIKPEVGKLLFLQQFRDDNREFLEFHFHIQNANDYEVIDLTTTTHGTKELARCEFIDPTREEILPMFLRTINIATYITEDLPVYIFNEL